MIIRYLGTGTTQLVDFTNITKTLVNGDTIQVDDPRGVELTQLYPEIWESVNDVGGTKQGFTAAQLLSTPIIDATIGGTAWESFNISSYVSNGTIQADLLNIEPIPQEDISFMYGRVATLFQRWSGTAIETFWIVGDEFDISMGQPALPIEAGSILQTGAIPILSVVYVNFSGSTLTMGVDKFIPDLGGDIITFPYFGEEQEVGGNGKIIYSTANSRLELDDNLFVTESGTVAFFNAGDDVSIDLLQGQIIEDGQQVILYVCVIAGELELTTINIKGGKKIALVAFENTTGNPREFGVDDMNDLDLNALIPFTGNGGGGGGGASNIIQGYSNFDFRRFGSPVLVKRNDMGNIVPAMGVFDEYYGDFTNAVTTDFSQCRIDNETVFQAYVSAGALRGQLAKYNGVTGSLNNVGGVAQSTPGNNVDTAKKIHTARVSHDKAVSSYVSTNGDAVISLRDISGATANLMWTEIVLANDCIDIQVFEGETSAYTIGDLGKITFGLSNSDDNKMYVGFVSVDANWQPQSVTINKCVRDTVGDIDVGAVWQIKGCGINSKSTGYLLVVDEEHWYGGIDDGVIPVGAYNSWTPPSPISAIRIANVPNDPTRWLVGYILDNGLVYASPKHFDGINLNSGPFTDLALPNAGRNTAQWSLDIYVGRDQKAFITTTGQLYGGPNILQRVLVEFTAFVAIGSVLEVGEYQLTQAGNRTLYTTFLNSTEPKPGVYTQNLFYMAWQESTQTSIISMGYGENAQEGTNLIVTDFVGIPQPDRIIGVVSGTTGKNTQITVYCGGPAPLNVGTDGTIIYTDPQYIGLGGDRASNVKIGVMNSGLLHIDIGPAITNSFQQYSGTIDLRNNTNTVFVNRGNQFNTLNLSDSLIGPITLVAAEDGVSAVINDLGHEGIIGQTFPSLVYGNRYIPFSKKGDSITIQKRLTAFNNSEKGIWEIIDVNGEGGIINLDIASPLIYDSNIISIPPQYKDATYFRIPIFNDMDIDKIKGLDIGHIFTIEVASSTDRMRFGITSKSTAINGDIIDGAAGHIDIFGGDTITFQVTDNYVLKVVGVQKYV